MSVYPATLRLWERSVGHNTPNCCNTALPCRSGSLQIHVARMVLAEFPEDDSPAEVGR